MSSSNDPIIDPALRDLPPPTRGMKRKAAANSKTAPAPPPSSGGRVTRRSAQVKEVAPQPPPSSEPARGEEENLIGYGRNREASTSKRSRRRSPELELAEWSHPGPLGGIENLAAAAAYQSNPPSSTPPTTYPYPFGLTPYRYPCLTPHLPQPPAGDPNNPNFRPFDPAEAESYHQSLVQNNQAYSTLASFLEDGRDKA